VDEEKANIEVFGCDSCWPASTESASEARRSLSIDARLIHESHFSIIIFSCPKCRQRFVSVFTEMVDWADGEDPQLWTVLPITEQEVTKLSEAGCRITSMLNALAPQRRSLCRDFPKGEKPTAYWSLGISVGPP
jgi:hypothetical protein